MVGLNKLTMSILVVLIDRSLSSSIYFNENNTVSAQFLIIFNNNELDKRRHTSFHNWIYNKKICYICALIIVTLTTYIFIYPWKVCIILNVTYILKSSPTDTLIDTHTSGIHKYTHTHTQTCTYTHTHIQT